MPQFTFFHVLSVRRSRANGCPQQAVVRGIVAEAVRAPFACKHVCQPLPPTLLFGCSPKEAGQLAEEQAAGARDMRGFRLRKDSIVMCAAVASYPVPTRDVIERDGDTIVYDDPHYLAWRSAVMEFARAEFGDALKSVVEHVDEEYPHLHMFIVPHLVDGMLSFDGAHPGKAAQAADAKDRTTALPKPAQRSSYTDAMRALLDRYHATVGEPFGHDRFGPGRARWARSVKLEIDRQAEALEKKYADEAAEAEARREAEASKMRDQTRARYEKETTAERSRLRERAKKIFNAHFSDAKREIEGKEARLDSDHQTAIREARNSRLRADRLQREAEELRRELDRALALITERGLVL